VAILLNLVKYNKLIMDIKLQYNVTRDNLVFIFLALEVYFNNFGFKILYTEYEKAWTN